MTDKSAPFVLQRAREILAAQYQRDDHLRAESILMGNRDKRAVDAVAVALSAAPPAPTREEIPPALDELIHASMSRDFVRRATLPQSTREEIARMIDEMVSGPTFGNGETELRESHRQDQLAAADAILASLGESVKGEALRERRLLVELEEAARDYAGRYLLDQATDIAGCVCGEDQHLAAKRLCDAIADIDAALATPKPDNAPGGQEGGE